MLNDPRSFSTKVTINGYNFEYCDINEVCQGGPLIGKISINGNKIEGKDFGGPFLLQNNLLIVPVFFRGFFSSGFKIGAYYIENKNLAIYGKLQDLIILNKIDNGVIFYFTEYNCKQELQFHLPVPPKNERLEQTESIK